MDHVKGHTCKPLTTETHTHTHRESLTDNLEDRVHRQADLRVSPTDKKKVELRRENRRNVMPHPSVDTFEFDVDICLNLGYDVG